MNFINKEIDEKLCFKYLLGILIFIILVLGISFCELMIPKKFNKNIEIVKGDEYAVSIENITKNRLKLSISGYAFKGPDAIETFNSYYILKNTSTGNMYRLKTKMEKRGNFDNTGVELSGMHSQALTTFMKKGIYDLYIWYNNNNENVFLKTDKQIEI